MRTTLVATAVLLLTAVLHAPRGAVARVQAVQETDECFCSYYHGSFNQSIGRSFGGCRITKAAPTGRACRCTQLFGLPMCTSRLASCFDPDSPKCRKPDTSIQSCLQTSGNCKGYKDEKDTCECGSKWQMYIGSMGCIITKAAPKGTACYCSWDGMQLCFGSVVRCRNIGDEACNNPSMSKESCLMGGGNCEGYAY